jgi:hAT family C-terminal dimerisation region
MSGKDDFLTLFQYALDTLFCPAMLTECERVFSSAKKLITPERNQLEEDIIEACECLKGWRNSLIEQQFGHFKKQKE